MTDEKSSSIIAILRSNLSCEEKMFMIFLITTSSTDNISQYSSAEIARLLRITSDRLVKIKKKLEKKSYFFVEHYEGETAFYLPDKFVLNEDEELKPLWYDPFTRDYITTINNPTISDPTISTSGQKKSGQKLKEGKRKKRR